MIAEVGRDESDSQCPIGRTVVGALIISVVRVGMTFVGVDIFAQQIVFGVVLILAVAVTIDRTKILIVK